MDKFTYDDMLEEYFEGRDILGPKDGDPEGYEEISPEVETLISQIVKALGEFEHKTERKSYIEYDENTIKIDLFCDKMSLDEIAREIVDYDFTGVDPDDTDEACYNLAIDLYHVSEEEANEIVDIIMRKYVSLIK